MPREIKQRKRGPAAPRALIVLFVEAMLQNPLDTPGARQMASWTLRVAADPIFGSLLLRDPHIFALLYAACAVTIEPPSELQLENTDTLSVEPDRLMSTLKDLQRQFGPSTSGQFASSYLAGIAVHAESRKDEGHYASLLQDWQEQAEACISQTISSEETNLQTLSELLELTRVERELLYFQLNRSRPGFSQLYDVLLHSEGLTAPLLGRALEATSGEISDALAEDAPLVRSGLLSVEQRPLRIAAPSAYLRATLAEDAPDRETFMQRFVRPLVSESSTASLARLDERDQPILLGLLRLPMPQEHGLHTLIYGPSSVDKRDMLARLLQEEDISGYVVSSKNLPVSDLPAWTTIAQAYLQEVDSDAVLVVERAEQALAKRHMSLMSLFGMEEEGPSGEDEERASDEGLTGARLRCLWLTDQASFLSERNLGRFLFHCQALPGSRANRRERITNVISEFGLTPELEHHLAKYSLLGEAQVRKAATLANILDPNDQEARDTIIRRAVAQSQKALGRDHTEELRDSVTHYSLANLNVSGRFTPQHIVRAMKKKPRGTMCLYGIPGAGKTQLAEYLAVEMDLPMVRRQASDLLSKWLGESEKNIAQMFSEAEAEGAILFLDEADSFLRDRSLARAEWSVTQVNELLQQMERFPGIFIAATNLMRDVDAAALRRFTFKLEFLALKPEQAWNMFLAESQFDPTEAKAEESAELQDRLKNISNLAPGDFATVKRQATMLDETLTPDAWLEQLAAEAKAKMLGLDRNKMGFQ